jgi:GrpB-like predicted nucleotidyltransferase (UPF0157 family)
MSDPVILVPYDPIWKQLASEEALRISACLKDQLYAIHHIGSTSIPGIKAKPILDLMGVVKDLTLLDQCSHLLEQIGYKARGENGIPGRRYFSKPSQGARSHHLHFFQIGDPNIDRMLLFRDYLLAHPVMASAYEGLKEILAAEYSNDRRSYSDAKTAFIRDIERRAIQWKQNVSP